MNRNQVMALAAMCQAALQVQKLARYGQAQESECEPLLHALLVTNPNNVEDVFGATYKLKNGYKALVEQLSSGGTKNVELVKYVGGLVQLERSLSANSQALSQLGNAISMIKTKAELDGVLDSHILAEFADIYARIISPLGQRIQVFGSPELLKQSHIQHQIRALLLSGIRAAVLWRQLGGKRRDFLFSKRKIIALAKEYV